MSSIDHRRTSGSAPRRATAVRAAAGVVVLLVGSLLAIGCGGSSTSSPDDITTTTSPVDLQYAAYADPAKPISVEAGKRFAIILPADPGSGWHWVMAPIDTAIVIALGSEFRDDEALRSKTHTALTTTTLDPALPTTTSSAPAGGTAPPSTATTPTTAAIPLVQVLSFAGRGVGTTTITFRYERIGSTEAHPITVTFTVNVSPLTVTTTAR